MNKKVKRLSFEQRIRLVVFIVNTIDATPDKQMRWTQIVSKCISHGHTEGPTKGTLKWCLDNGYIARPERGLYIVTEKGRSFIKSVESS